MDTSNAIQSRAYDLYKETIALIQEQATLFIRLGKSLKIIRDDKLYKYIGEGGFDTFQHFLNNPEIGLRQSTAYLYIRIYEYYIEQLKLSNDEVVKIGVTKLMRLLPVLKSKGDNEAKEIVTSIGEMTVFDADQEVKDKNLEIDRPKLFQDKATGKFIFEYKSEQMLKIINKTTGEVIEFGEMVKTV